LSFQDLVAGSDLVLSTSVQEGFGYLFINSLLWSLPLAARHLETLGGLKDLFKDYPAHFYDTIRVPLQNGSSLSAAYKSKIRGLSALIPETAREALLAASDRMAREDLVDFSYLPVGEQERNLREIASGNRTLLEELRKANAAELSKIEELLRSKKAETAERQQTREAELEARFGAAAYAEGFQRILHSFDERNRAPADLEAGNTMEPVNERVQRAFLKLENLRLLYDY
jgi:hypothetical protein